MSMFHSFGRHPLATLALVSAVSLAPLAAQADDDDDHYRKYSRSGQPYSMEEIRTLNEARALKRYGPGSTATIVSDKERGTYTIQLRNRDNQVLRETEVNVYGRPVRYSDDD